MTAISKKPWEKSMMSKNKNIIYKKIVKELDLDIIKPPRAGVILYTKYNNAFWFGLGVDAKSKDLTDFGGGISYKENHDKHVIAGAIREFNEESLNIFNFTMNDFLESPVIYNNQCLIIFKYITCDIDHIKSLFRQRHDEMINHHIIPEVCDMTWLHVNDFKQCINVRGKMFHRVQNLLQKAGHFYWLL
ncbi:MAG TPA: hypothetical protein VLG50_07625 [Candidatus Saccharimonadales bacterium]|nr:hypothetical protein [Candidatus Saccharimonadales bacterium]